MIKRILFFLVLLAQSGSAEERPGASYKEGTGVTLSEETRNSIGLKMAEVEDQVFAGEIKITAQVYKEASEPGKAYGIAHASAFVSSSQYIAAREGQIILLTSPSSVTGTLVRVDTTMTPLTGRSELLVEVPDPENRLGIGDFVQAVFTGSKRSEVTAIPEEAVLRTAYGNFVFVLNGSSLLRTPVKTGASRGGYVEVVDGLFSGDEVVVRAAESLYQIELRATKGGAHCH